MHAMKVRLSGAKATQSPVRDEPEFAAAKKQLDAMRQKELYTALKGTATAMEDYQTALDQVQKSSELQSRFKKGEEFQKTAARFNQTYSALKGRYAAEGFEEARKTMKTAMNGLKEFYDTTEKLNGRLSRRAEYQKELAYYNQKCENLLGTDNRDKQVRNLKKKEILKESVRSSTENLIKDIKALKATEEKTFAQALKAVDNYQRLSQGIEIGAASADAIARTASTASADAVARTASTASADAQKALKVACPAPAADDHVPHYPRLPMPYDPREHPAPMHPAYAPHPPGSHPYAYPGMHYVPGEVPNAGVGPHPGGEEQNQSAYAAQYGPPQQSVYHQYPPHGAPYYPEQEYRSHPYVPEQGYHPSQRAYLSTPPQQPPQHHRHSPTMHGPPSDLAISGPDSPAAFPGATPSYRTSTSTVDSPGYPAASPGYPGTPPGYPGTSPSRHAVYPTAPPPH